MGALQTKTTIQIDPELLYQAKLKALQEKVTLKEIVEKSIANYIQNRPKSSKKGVKIGGYNLGGIKTTLTREEIYDHL
jgi:hypothetical protein